MFGKLFQPRAHYVFDYKPRYYNERKERIQNLEDKYHSKKNDDSDDSPKMSLIKNSLKNDWIKSKRSATDKSSNLRLALIIAILAGLAAYILELHTLF